MAKTLKTLDTSALDSEDLARLEQLRLAGPDEGCEAIETLQTRRSAQSGDWCLEDQLYNAARFGRLLDVALVLEAGADAMASDAGADNKNALMAAAQSGDAACIRLLLPVSDIDATDDRGRTALRWAAIDGRWASIEALLEAGADPNIRAEDGLSAFEECARFGAAEWELIERDSLWDSLPKTSKANYPACLDAMLDCPRVDHIAAGPYGQRLGAMLIDDHPLLGRAISQKEDQQLLAAALAEGRSIAADALPGSPSRQRPKML